MLAPMKRPGFAGLGCLVLGLLLGCGHGSKRLSGHWRGVRAEGVSPEVQTAANAFAGKMSIDVTGDVIVVTTATDKQSGHYKTTTDEKRKVVIVTDKDGANDPQTFFLPDDKTLKWMVDEGKAIVFTKD